jgi:NTP pyrophosphatase (non-canonical NTP hydrolase)
MAPARKRAPLGLREYQQRAQSTDRLPEDGGPDADPRLAPLLGLAGEVGTLLAGYKKWLRDGQAYELFDSNVEEELGDILWYLANAAERWNLDLEQVARHNLDKTRDRWSPKSERRRRRRPDEHLDATEIRSEQLPRTFEVLIQPVDQPTGPEPKIELIWRGKRRADELGDNTYSDSGYRFHDVFHLANAAVLGWSPVARGKIFERKRRSNEETNAVEDGGRAIVIEEGVAAFMFAYAANHDFLRGLTRLDFSALKTFRALTSGLEVDRRPLWEVEEAIIQGFRAWDRLQESNGGWLRGDMAARRLEYLGPP